MGRFRKKDYIISFFFLLLSFVISITPVNGIIVPIIKSFFAALIGALLLGTITNLIFPKKTRPTA
ncbi:hypothetical protein GGR02_002124 [Anoxybacillus voinovskiensis]|uniref:Uncharacterized protein n=1 Tax=Anoxybacteroides voinovskiense TaxID=230470 RepID=A0A840DWH4_9BACL|nr:MULTISPECIES: hypothetical protein [Anoxybacillus]MBB4074358.1 hypothetical protein [Anoxybacillus voinovskiensis]MCL6585355.1 hypothetical protein [Anoxybacillus sp.]GGJ70457.1 hypothetical protein GCM10008982_19790 [Anoxybacillus voinovskiensis]